MSRYCLSAALLVAGGCGDRLSGSDVRDLEKLSAAMTQVPDDMLAAILIQGASEVGPVAGSGGCRKGLAAWNGMDASQRATIAHAMRDDCHFACPRDWAPLADVAPAERMTRMLADCDAAAPDPVFGGPLAGERKKMDFAGYVVTRHVVDRMRTLLEKEGSPQARAVAARLTAEVPRLAKALAAPTP